MEGKLAARLDELLRSVSPVDEDAARDTQKRWDSLAKPLKSLGLLEKNVAKIAGIHGSSRVDLKKRALVAMCADNGVIEEGVTQTGSEVTAIVAENMAVGSTTVTVMAEAARTDVFPVDIGMATEGCLLEGVPKEEGELLSRTLLPRKVRRGTRNFAKGPAMTREEALRAVLVGIEIAGRLKAQGYDILATGEMGIGNTTTSSAVAAALLSQPVEQMTGKGAGLSDEGLQRKIKVIQEALENLKPDREDPMDILVKVGGYDIAGMTGLFLGGAIYRIPVLIDGFISSVAALLAMNLEPLSRDYMIASHVSKEPAGQLILDELGLKPMLCCEMCLGEGTGAVAALSVLDMGLTVYHRMATFDDMNVEQYQPL
ncbi:nicotinate-nucleotide--dimethylbenzimidazole phosphoribosyltransferase [Qiania dongpingensis]|uniref:Nicotinate-nucleotide--dimethylbenzimidazole phosphoribosyltransferase n=2 Tax=Qiania dongpingensis TaxID=2763669 RepID=A0A7G9G7X2_9FIRM|nr:nicotinate-nucleotide--dimethylbenzimidazole phosphoribosyltransferase [Qiania dongpingensis]